MKLKNKKTGKIIRLKKKAKTKASKSRKTA